MSHLRQILCVAPALACLLTASCSAGDAGAPGVAPNHIVVNASKRAAPISADQLGTNLGIWYDVATPSLPPELARLHARLIRWPGGSFSDYYHWKTQTQCVGHTIKPAYNTDNTFPHFMEKIIMPGHYRVAITVNYGTNPTCNGGGDPREAAAWVAYAVAHGYASHIKFWTVGNESFGNWEVDLHSKPHDPAVYAAAMNGPNGYYALMKAADPNAKIGVIVAGSDGFHHWDRYVLSHAKYDFVELHWYAQQPGHENDSYLLYRAPRDFTKAIRKVQSELRDAGRPATPIMVGEVNSVAYNPGKQSVSIVNALFAGQILAEGIEDGLAADAWWFAEGAQQFCGTNNSPNLYGFQNWGSYDLIFAHTQYNYNNCTTNTGGPIVPEGAVSPSGEAFRLFTTFARPGQWLLATASGSRSVRAFAATQGSGYALLLFNLKEDETKTITITLQNAHSATYSDTALVYGKQQYDKSRNNVWANPVEAHLREVHGTFTVSLPPWSITLLQLRKSGRKRPLPPHRTQ